MNNIAEKAWLPDYILQDGRFIADMAILCDPHGRITRLLPASQVSDPLRLPNQALLPGLVNAHSHAFQRVIRARTEYRSANEDNFWTWREQMYSAASRLGPTDIYQASRMAFLEMALSGITTVGEFHYIHHAPDGQRYADANLLSREVIRAAVDVGIRIVLLRVAYARAGFQKDPNPLQVRFIESADSYLKAVDSLARELSQVELAEVGVAPHSVRAVPFDYLKTVITFAGQQKLPVHMHVAEQPGEVAECISEYGRSPFALLQTEGLLSERFTAVHAIHVTPKAIDAFARTGAHVCACPTTERNLGDGVVPAADYFAGGVKVSLGTDSQVQIDLLEDARELEYHLRLQRRERNVLASDEGRDTLARGLFECATSSGAASLGVTGGLVPGADLDFFTVDLNDPTLTGSSNDDLLSSIVFSSSRAAICNVVVAGKQIVEDGRHIDQSKIVSDFQLLQKELWSG